MLLFAVCVCAFIDTVDLTGHTVVLSADDGYHSLYREVYPLLKRYGMTMTLGVIVGNVGTGRPSYGHAERFLNREEIQEMLDSCDIEIASHTITHPWLTRLDSAAAWHEIRGSKLALEQLFGRSVPTFIYPYGDENARIRRLVRNAGYRLARAVRAGDIDFWMEPYRLPEFELRREVTLEQAKRHVASRRNAILLFHRIVSQPRVFTEWPVSEFVELLAWLHARGARTTTLADLYYDWWREKTVGMMAGKALPATVEDLFQQVDVDATRTPHTR